jgi:polar amino acid transport system permease protein
MGEKAWSIRGLRWADIIYIFNGALYTIELSLIAIMIGLLVAIVIGILRTVDIKFLNLLSRIYVEIFRGTPILIQIFIFYYGLRIFNVKLPALLSASMAFIFNIGAQVGETLKGIIDNIPKSQWEASSSLGLTYLQQLRYVILPQVIRSATPPTVGICVGIIKDTSLASIVGFIELTRAGSQVMALTKNPYSTFPIVAVIYFIICYPLTRFSRKLEERLKYK